MLTLKRLFYFFARKDKNSFWSILKQKVDKIQKIEVKATEPLLLLFSLPLKLLKTKELNLCCYESYLK